MLFGNLDGEVEALQQREAVYEEERRLSEGSDSCWSCSDSDSDSVAELEVDSEPLALEGAVVVVTLGGEVEGAARGLAGKRKREDELTQQPARHSLWEQDSLEACNEWLFGYLDGEVEVLQQRKAVYDEERRLSDGSDSCWSGAGSDSDSEAELVVGSRPPALEGAVMVAAHSAQEGELVGVGQGPLQPDGKVPAVLGKRVQREGNPLHSLELAPKRMRDLATDRQGQGKQQQRKGGKGQGGAEQRRQGNGKWGMPGFSVDLGSAVQVAGNYSVKAVQTQVTLQGTAGRETWLGVDLLRGGRGGKVTGWMQSYKLQGMLTGWLD